MKQIILDLGGVLIQLDWERRVGNLLGQDFDRQAVLQVWHDSGAVNALETGRISFEDFAKQFKQEFSIDASIELIKSEFLQFVQSPYPGVDELLTSIKNKGYGLSLLSNTSQPHFEYLHGKYDFFKHFDQLFLSYKIGIMKPAKSIYQCVVNELHCDAKSCYFFDDGLKNIESAIECGLNAFQVNSPADVAKHLEL